MIGKLVKGNSPHLEKEIKMIGTYVGKRVKIVYPVHGKFTVVGTDVYTVDVERQEIKEYKKVIPCWFTPAKTVLTGKCRERQGEYRSFVLQKAESIQIID